MTRKGIDRHLFICAALVAAACTVPGKAAILKALDDGDPAGAVAAAAGDSRSAAFLARRILVDGAKEPATRDLALSLLGGAGSGAAPVAEELARESDPVLRARALLKLHALGRGGALDKLERFLDAPEGLARAAAVEAFVMEGQSKGFMERFIADPEVEVRRAVVQGLWGLELAWADAMLLDAAKNDPDAGVRLAATRALEPEVETHLELLRSLVKGNDPLVVPAALGALAKRPALIELPWLATALEPPVREEGIYFAAALLKAKEPGPAGKAAAYMKLALFDEKPTIRMKAVAALIATGRALDEAKELGDDPSTDVLVKWAVWARKHGLLEAKRLAALRKLAGAKDRVGLLALVALSEEKKVKYAEFRKKVWARFKLSADDDASDAIYLLSHVGRSIDDPPLALEAMKSEDGKVRLHGAAAFLRHTSP